MTIRILLVPLLFLWICVFPANAQNDQYNFSKVNIENGLSHNQVNAIYRDEVGFIWFGTNAGLNRFDGFNCKVFVNIPADSSSIEDDFILGIFPFPGNKLWISSKDSISLYDPITEKFDRNYRKYLRSIGLPGGRIINILKDKKNDYWFLFENGFLYKYFSQSKKIAPFDFRRLQLPFVNFTSINQDINGNVWAINANGLLFQLDPVSLQPIKRVALLSDFNKNKASDYRIFVDKKNDVWAWINGEPKGAFKIDVTQNLLTQFNTENAAFRLNNNLVVSIMQDKEGRIWMGTDHGGINLVDEEDNTKITYLLNKENDNTSLSYNSIQTIYQDDNGLIWVGTGKKGVSYLDQNITQFELYKHEADNKNSLPFNDINYFTEDKKGNVWIGTNGGGLIYFNRLQNKFTQYVNDPSNSNSLSNNVIVSLCLDYEGKLWVGTFLGGMDVFDGKTFTHYRHNAADDTSISDDGIWHILEDDTHTLWIGTLKGGLNKFDRQTQKFTHYNIQKNIPNPIHSNYISVIRQDHLGNLWVGTSEGVEVLNKERTKFTYYTHTKDSNSISHQNILDICEDRRNFIWIGTRNGLNVINRQTQKIKRFTTTDGLPDNIISNIIEDREGNLWITTSKGLCRLAIVVKNGDVSFVVRNFGESNKLMGRVFNESAGLITADGKIIFGGSNGFNIIDPNKVRTGNTKPNLVITNIDISNNDVNIGQAINRTVVLRKALPYTNEIVLNYNENIFSIEFAALDFSHTNQYAYQLQGFNDKWINANSASRKVTYTNLDPGTYYFRVKATNSDGVWNGREKTLKIIIKPLFWKTSAAFLLYAVLISVILFFSRRLIVERTRMRFQVEHQLKEAERIEALDAIKTKFFTNVSHEFRTPLSLILTPLDKIINGAVNPEQKKHLQLIQRNAKRLLSLVNQLLDFRKMEVKEFKLQPTESDIIQFIKEITWSFSDLSEMKNIALSFKSNVETFITWFDKDKLEKILFNLLSNAFKYTHSNGYLEVKVAYIGTKESFNEELEIIVKDTGIGIPLDKQDQIFERFFQNNVPANITNPGTGIGLAIAKEFVKLHNGTIRVSSEPDRGTAFIVTLPVQRPETIFAPGEDFIEPVTVLKEENEALKLNGKSNKKSLPIILLAEDNDDFRFYLKDNLKQHYQVFETSNGQEAWEELQKTRPDLIVSDVMMPYMDGIELTRKVKKHPGLCAIPVILLTAVGDEELHLESYKLGVSDYITKPFTFEILAFRIKNTLAQKNLNGKATPKLIEVSPGEVEVPAADEQFIKQVLLVVEKNISNAGFTVEELSKELFMHRAGMYRKVLALTGKTPIEFIRLVRLKRGAQLLEKSQLNIGEIAYEVGFNNPKKFSQYFKEEFGKTPSQYQKSDSKPSQKDSSAGFEPTD